MATNRQEPPAIVIDDDGSGKENGRAASVAPKPSGTTSKRNAADTTKSDYEDSDDELPAASGLSGGLGHERRSELEDFSDVDGGDKFSTDDDDDEEEDIYS